MVNYSSFSSAEIDGIFKALSDPTRRDILERLTEHDLTVTQIAKPYEMSLPAISKHLSVLERAHLVRRHKIGREYSVQFSPETMRVVATYVSFYEKFWSTRIANLGKFLERQVKYGRKKRS